MPGRHPPLVCHVIHALRMGGLENGLVNLINRMPAERYRHAVICLSSHDRFAERIARADVEVFALHKREGKDPLTYWRLWRLLRRLRPAIVHTRNLGAVDAHLPAWLAGVRVRIHGEHGRDIGDLQGANRRHRLIRRSMRPFVHHYIPLSRDLEDYLRETVGVAPARITRIVNGVDVGRFRPAGDGEARAGLLAECGWPADSVLVGWVGRMEPVKNVQGLVEAFARLLETESDGVERARLLLVGDGSQYAAVAASVQRLGLGDRVRLTGARDDVPELLRTLDLFALPSLAEGISNTTLEAMASGVPVVATDVGGNAELIRPGETGELVAAGDPGALARGLAIYLARPPRLSTDGRAARHRAVETYSIDAMVSAYADLYDRVLAERGGTATGDDPARSETA